MLGPTRRPHPVSALRSAAGNGALPALSRKDPMSPATPGRAPPSQTCDLRVASAETPAPFALGCLCVFLRVLVSILANHPCIPWRLGVGGVGGQTQELRMGLKPSSSSILQFPPFPNLRNTLLFVCVLFTLSTSVSNNPMQSTL